MSVHPRVGPITRARAGVVPLGPVDLAARWPDVARVPRRPVRAAVARRLFRRAVAGLPVRVVLREAPGVEIRWGTGGPVDPVMTVHDPDAFFARLGAGGLIGFGESYMAGEWTAHACGPDGEQQADPVPLLTELARRMAVLVPPVLQNLRRLAVRRQPVRERNTLPGARRNIARHYDLSNDLFATFLDEGLTYSAAMFAPADGPPTLADLRPAQDRKIDRLLDAAGVGAGSEVLEIGTGWGELAIRAAARGARVHSITLSQEQLDLARRRVADAGLADRVRIELRDYRALPADATGRFDAVLSVEMIEAVGESFWPAYFQTLSRVLAPGGRIGLQAITMPHDRMTASRRTYTWMHKYVFPGGLIPSVTAVHAAAGAAGLRVSDDVAFGIGYADTLRLWRRRFEAAADRVEELGFDAVFRRLWQFYLAYCEAGFRSGYLDVHQFVLQHEGAPR
jgi:cyclopropane-fatty-acyl-phospholipid synthase